MTDEVFTTAAIRWVRRGDYLVSPAKAAEIDAKAAEFDRNRLEQIRQLERSIALISKMSEWYAAQASVSMRMGLADSCGGECRDEASIRRGIARLESALADLKRGME